MRRCRLSRAQTQIPPLLALCLLLLAPGCSPPLQQDEEAQRFTGTVIDTTLPRDEFRLRNEPRGRVVLEPDRVCAGYTLYSYPAPNASAQHKATLLDMGGKVVHQWDIVGMPVVLLPGGSLLGSIGQRPNAGTTFQDAISVVQVSWDGEIEWSFSDWDADGLEHKMSRQHHDLQREGNPVNYYAPGQEPKLKGKTLILAHLDKLVPAISSKVIQDDVIYEVDADGNIGPLVWQAADHFEELGFSDEQRRAIYDNPRWDDKRQAGDWLHINAVSRLGKNKWFDASADPRFHPENMMISSREAGIVAIIDHKTGSLVWRVGPDYTGDTAPWGGIGPLVGQHDPHMIPYGLPGAGNILVLDNGGYSGYGGTKGYPKYQRGYSRVLEIDPSTFEVVWSYGGPVESDEHFFCWFVGSVQRLPNGNTLVGDGANGQMFEVTLAKQVVWRQHSTVDSGNNYFYRARRVPPEWIPAGANTGGYPSWSVKYSTSAGW